MTSHWPSASSVLLSKSSICELKNQEYTFFEAVDDTRPYDRYDNFIVYKLPSKQNKILCQKVVRSSKDIKEGLYTQEFYQS